MKLIIPMAGMGKRMRPHTLTIPKPLVKVAGKSIVQRLVEDIAGIVGEQIEEIAFIIGDFGSEVEQNLLEIASSLGSKGKIYYQDEPLGTGHAIHCARESLNGDVVVAFADTLFKADFKIDKSLDGLIWVNKVEDPSQFGVVKLDGNLVTDFIEKPKEYISDLAIIGIYYFSKAEKLREELDYLIDNNVTVKGEYQLTDALENLKNKNYKFGFGAVDQWLDCGNVQATVNANTQVLNNIKKDLRAKEKYENTVIIEPCFIDEGAQISNSVIGPGVSLGKDVKITNSRISNSIVNDNSNLQNIVITDSLIGYDCEIEGNLKKIDIGDYSKIRI